MALTAPLLVLAPHGRDAAVISRVLHRAGIVVETCPDLASAIRRLDEACALVLTEEVLAGVALAPLFDWVARQPTWSDLPFLVLVSRLAGAHAARRTELVQGMGNAVLLERPLNAEGLASAGLAAVRARRRQLAMREMTETLESRVVQRTQALAETEARFRAVFEGFPESLFVIRAEPDGRFVYESRNPAAAQRSGLPDGAVLERTPGQIMGADQASEVSAALRRCVETGSSIEVSGPMTFPSGTRHYEMTLTPMHDATGRIARVLGIARDVTERNQLEARLRQAQKLEAIGQLTGGVAHDFNNLLQVVLSGLALMERVADPARRAHLADSVRRAAERGGELTKRLLTVARRQSLQPQPTDLAAWLRDGAGELLMRTLRGDIRTVLLVPDGLPDVEVDPSELELALLNLAVNARDAMEAAGGTITVDAEATTLDGSAGWEGLSGDFVRLSVTDTGQGMDAATQARVFEPFFTTKEVGKGTGLGLAQVYGFVKQSGGAVRLRSAPGHGTTVSLLLPVATRPAVAGHAARPAAAGPVTAGKAVLVVEDDDNVSALVVDMVAQLGHRPTLVTTAAAALGALAEGGPVDLLFTDVLMPGGMDGMALAREAKRRRPGLRVLLTTGYTGAGSLEAPADLPLLRKPYRIEELGSMLERVLAGGERVGVE